jgi:hypothetical protein
MKKCDFLNELADNGRSDVVVSDRLVVSSSQP